MFELTRRSRALRSLALAAGLSASWSGPAAAYWTDAAQPAVALPAITPPVASAVTTPRAARLLTLDLEALRSRLRGAPAADSSTPSTTVISVPMPDGSSLEFTVRESAVMHPELAARYPGIRTYVGTAVSDPAISGRFSIGPRGFRGMVQSALGTAYIDPVSRTDSTQYRSYFRRDLPNRRLAPDTVMRGAAATGTGARIGTQVAGSSRAGTLRTYRLALAANGEYSRYQDPPSVLTDQPDRGIVLAELVNVTNRVSGIYERDLGIRLQLVPNEDEIIFTSPLLDPYADRQGTLSLAVNTGVINRRIGADAYDIGHVVTTGGGGIAGLGVVCGAGVKGQGVTGLPEPVGDGFYVDFVAHEMGHQFGANHTFNSQAGNCAGGNRNGDTAYEPGSGTTIMAYAGICADDDIQSNSDDIFHGVSFDEIVAYTTNDTGSSCGAASATTNRAPVVTVPSGGFTIPRSTPFELTGTARDPDGDALRYLWEQFDLGAGGAPDAPDASAPLFRTFVPAATPTRLFPQASDLFGGVHTLGELLPAVSRSLNFRLTVRDYRVAPSAGGVASAALSFNVVDTAGPFVVTAPAANATGIAGSPIDVAWDVAGTDVAPVACGAVDIEGTTNQGSTWIRLRSATGNDGRETVPLPNVVTTGLRLRVKCSNNVFFNVAPATITVTASSVAPRGSGGVEDASPAGGGGGGASAPLLLAGLSLLVGLRRRRRGAA